MKLKNPTLRKNQFEDMALSETLLNALNQMKMIKPTDVQAQAIPEALLGTDIIGVAQTGSGKTLAFTLPLLTHLENNPQARGLILAPSREMAQQILKVSTELAKELPISICLVIGGIPSSKQISALKKIPRLIIATPGRLNDHLITNKLLLQNMEFIVIDEADRMLDMGFAPQLKIIQNTLRGKRQTLMFSASFNSTVESIAELFMNSNSVMIRSEHAEAPVESLKQRVLFIEASKKNDRLLDELNATKGGVIVFCGNQANCERTGQYLKEYGYETDLIHGGLSQGHRNRVVREFREGKIRVLVATDLLARGIDVPHVDHVFNFDLPFQAEDFLHRIGRTARAGRLGDALTFVTSSDEKMYLKIKAYLDGATEIKLDPNFAFSARRNYHEESYSNKYESKKSFDGTRKTSTKPAGKSISLAEKPQKPRNDKYKDLAALSNGLGKPSVWKKNNQPPRKKM